MISKEVADYLNNKFGDDFTLSEPYPYWMKAPDQEDTRELEDNNKLKTQCIMSKTKDWLMDLETVSFDDYLAQMGMSREEYEKEFPYAPPAPIDYDPNDPDQLPF